MEQLQEGLGIILVCLFLVVPQIIAAQAVVDEFKGKNGKK